MKRGSSPQKLREEIAIVIQIYSPKAFKTTKRAGNPTKVDGPKIH